MSTHPSQPSLDPRAAVRQGAQDVLTHTDALKDDPHFAWFVSEVLEPARDTAHDAALSTQKTDEECRQARWQHAALSTLCGEVARRRAGALEQLGLPPERT